MPYFERGDVTIYYADHGAGFPLLLFGPGGMNSTVDAWKRATINPLTVYRGDFRLIAMDQRNFGQSTGPLDVTDPWGSFAGDQLALLDHLGIDRFHLMGCFIGGPYALKLIEQAPARIRAVVLEQPSGVVHDNAHLFDARWRTWATGMAQERADIDLETAEEFGTRMWQGADFMVSVSRDFIRSCITPMLVLPGTDEAHPTAVGRELAALAPQGELLELWKDTSEHTAQAVEVVRRFLRNHTPE